MKVWVLTALAVKSKLAGLCDVIDDRIEKFSLDMSSPAVELYDKIVFWNDVRRKVVNINVMVARMMEVLSENERKLIGAYVRGRSIYDIADKLEISKSAVHRRITSITYKCARVLNNLGITKAKLDEDYSGIELIMRTYKKLCKKDEIFKSEVCETLDHKRIELIIPTHNINREGVRAAVLNSVFF